ncbi:MAG: hypothetical protein ACYS26_13910 [Planctomycetota bacterium]|jgi:hypothetical protein
MNVKAISIFALLVLSGFIWLFLMPGEAPHEEQSSGFVAPDLAPEGRKESVEGGAQVGLTTESGGRTYDASSEEELGDPWFIDRSDVAMT